MNSAEPEPLALLTTKSVLPLYSTTPLGLASAGPLPVPCPCGRLTTRDWGLPLPSYRVEVWVPLLATHTGPAGSKAMPQGFIRWLSVWAALTPVAPSDTRSVAE